MKRRNLLVLLRPQKGLFTPHTPQELIAILGQKMSKICHFHLLVGRGYTPFETYKKHQKMWFFYSSYSSTTIQLGQNTLLIKVVRPSKKFFIKKLEHAQLWVRLRSRMSEPWPFTAFMGRGEVGWGLPILSTKTLSKIAFFQKFLYFNHDSSTWKNATY